jgi:hypothetical protein
MLIYIHIVNTPYFIQFDYQPDDLAHFARLDALKQQLVSTNLYSNEELEHMFIPFINQNPRLEDLKKLEKNITKNVRKLIVSPVKFKLTLHTYDGRKVTPFFGRQNKQFWLGYLKPYDTIYASISY